MMSVYARVDSGVVTEIISPLLDENGDEYPISVRFNEDVLSTLVDITNLNPQPAQRWLYDGTSFTAPS